MRAIQQPAQLQRSLQLRSPATRLARAAARPLLRPARRGVQVNAVFENFINGLTVAIKNSPLNQGKIQLAIAQAGNYDVEATKAALDKYIAENDVVVFSWTTCPFCVKAKALLTDLGATYTAVELNTMENGNAFRAELAKLTERTSMPNIFIKGKSVGGCNDGPGVVTLNNEGKLVPLLKEAGAL